MELLDENSALRSNGLSGAVLDEMMNVIQAVVELKLNNARRVRILERY